MCQDDSSKLSYDFKGLAKTARQKQVHCLRELVFILHHFHILLCHSWLSCYYYAVEAAGLNLLFTFQMFILILKQTKCKSVSDVTKVALICKYVDSLYCDVVHLQPKRTHWRSKHDLQALMNVSVHNDVIKFFLWIYKIFKK